MRFVFPGSPLVFLLSLLSFLPCLSLALSQMTFSLSVRVYCLIEAIWWRHGLCEWVRTAGWVGLPMMMTSRTGLL